MSNQQVGQSPHGSALSSPFQSDSDHKKQWELNQGILDIRAKDTQTEEWIDLEVQVIHCDDYVQRSQYYLAGMLGMVSPDFGNFDN